MHKKIMNGVQSLSVSLFICVLLGSFYCVFANQFIAQQKPEPHRTKMPSKGKLQELCCQELVGIVRALPEILKSVADMQHEGMNHVCAFVEGDSSCTLKKLDAQALQKLHDELVTITQSIKDIQKKGGQYALKMRTL